jgi:hypothetical protein
VAARALDLAVAGTIALCTDVVERAEELEILQALNIFLSQCLSTEVENAMVRYEQLPEWQKTSLARLPEPYTADSVPNSQKPDEKMAVLESC